MEVYKSETQKIIKRFLEGRISFPECIAALDAALSGVMPQLITVENLDEVRALMFSNNEIIFAEMERRRQAETQGTHNSRTNRRG